MEKDSLHFQKLAVLSPIKFFSSRNLDDGNKKTYSVFSTRLVNLTNPEPDDSVDSLDEEAEGFLRFPDENGQGEKQPFMERKSSGYEGIFTQNALGENPEVFLEDQSGPVSKIRNGDNLENSGFVSPDYSFQILKQFPWTHSKKEDIQKVSLFSKRHFPSFYFFIFYLMLF
jgi:hypothetical protein